MKKKVYIDDFSWFDVSFDEDGEVVNVIECRSVWPPFRQHGPNAVMSERIRRAIEKAKAPDDDTPREG